MSTKGFIRSNWLYKKLNSVKTALLILGLMGGTMIIGTVFPQEMDSQRYINSWGVELYERYNALGFLHIFKSTWFLILTYIFSLNIIVCTYERYKTLLAKRKLKKKTLGKVFVNKGKMVEIIAPYSYSDITSRIHNLIAKKGFKIEKRHVSDKLSQLIIVKGISYLLISVLFHLGIFLCIIGFIQTYLDNYEDYVTIYPGEVITIDTVGRGTRFFKTLGFFQEGLNKYIGFDLEGYALSKEGRIKLGLKKFETEYTWFNEGYFPKDWKSDLVVYNQFDEEVIRKKIEVNTPIYYSGFAFYQAAYDQNVSFRIEENEETRLASPGEPFKVSGFDGEFMLGTIRTGKLFRRFQKGSEDIVANVDIYYISPVEPPKKGEVPKKPKKEKVGNLVIGEPKVIKGVTMSFDNFKEGSVVSYRRDAGVPILWFGSILVLVAMCIRIYFPYYKLRIQVEHYEDNKAKVITGGNCIGLMANLQKQIDNIIKACI